jgi:hypothetical protein
MNPPIVCIVVVIYKYKDRGEPIKTCNNVSECEVEVKYDHLHCSKECPNEDRANCAVQR